MDEDSDVFKLPAAGPVVYFSTFLPAQADSGEDLQTLGELIATANVEADAFDFDAWHEVLDPALAGGEEIVEDQPDYFLYWHGEGDTAYTLSEEPLDLVLMGYEDRYVLVPGGDALYAKFGQLGTYMDMDIAMGYGGIRPIEQAATLHLMDPELL